jgi:hypothetical protein
MPRPDLSIRFHKDLHRVVQYYAPHLDDVELVAPLLSWGVYLSIADSESYEEAVERVDQMVSHSFKAFEEIDD